MFMKLSEIYVTQTEVWIKLANLIGEEQRDTKFKFTPGQAYIKEKKEPKNKKRKRKRNLSNIITLDCPPNTDNTQHTQYIQHIQHTHLQHKDNPSDLLKPSFDPFTQHTFFQHTDPQHISQIPFPPMSHSLHSSTQDINHQPLANILGGDVEQCLNAEEILLIKKQITKVKEWEVCSLFFFVFFHLSSFILLFFANFLCR